MARHNEVTLYGQVPKPPRLYRSTGDPNDPDSRLLRVMGQIVVLRGIRNFGAADKRLRQDLPIVLSQNPRIMPAMAAWDTGDMILIRGTLATLDTYKVVTCPQCGHTEKVRYMISFVNPIFMRKEASGLTPEEGNAEMRENSEISNRITLLGKVCIDPVAFPAKNGKLITNYQLDVARKYRIREDDDANRHDFPFIKSYGEVADNDARAVKNGGIVFVDGAIQTRDYTRPFRCGECGHEFLYTVTATEVVPYSTEYLTGCKSMAEIAEEKQKEEEEALHRTKMALFGSDEPLERQNPFPK